VERYAKRVPKERLDKKLKKAIDALKKTAVNPSATKRELERKEKKVEMLCLVWSAKNHFVQKEEAAGIKPKKQGFVKKVLKKLNMI